MSSVDIHDTSNLKKEDSDLIRIFNHIPEEEDIIFYSKKCI